MTWCANIVKLGNFSLKRREIKCQKRKHIFRFYCSHLWTHIAIDDRILMLMAPYSSQTHTKRVTMVSSIQMEINKSKSDKMNVFLWIRCSDKHFHLMIFYDSDDYFPFGKRKEEPVHTLMGGGEHFIFTKQNGDRIHLVFNAFNMTFHDACRR